ELLRERTAAAAALGEARLRTLIRARSGERLEIGEDLLASEDERDLPAVAALVAEALPRRPEFEALERTRRSLVAQRRATVASSLPRVDAFAGGLVAHPNPRIVPQSAEFQPTWDVGVQVS
ncbi:MAG: hypothetical protein FJ104_04600, partial [Deltaproteobacteria bacterium]|nr:hypothetical protein [Deltaproteobacteria bacterium]